MKIKTLLTLLPIFLALFTASFAITGCKKPSTEAGRQFTCPMHPEVVQNAPGKCPKCEMPLVEKH